MKRHSDSISVIHSRSEEGFWHKKMGWVYRASTATKFTGKESNLMDNMPLSKDMDAEFVVVEYKE